MRAARPARRIPTSARSTVRRLSASALAEADYVVLAAPLTQDTRGMVDAPVLAAMEPGRG
ncbi:hypothetical protein GCM10010234_40850 [Streptomyces hawaiiensis]